MLTVAEIVAEAGLPEGAVSILPMTRELGDRMVSDDRFKLLTFTGSPSVGWEMKERAGKKKVVLELGGNAGVIVDRSADLDWAVRRILVGAFSYAGQVCISVQRMFVHEAIWDDFMARFVEGARKLKVGDPLDPTDRRRPDGGRSRPPPERKPGWTKPARWAARSCSAARRTARTSRRRPDRHAGRGAGLQQRGLRSARGRLPASPTSAKRSGR